MAINREYTINELAAKFGVSHRTLRFYEQKEIFYPRRNGLTRIYNAKDAVRLEIVLKGKRLGFSLAEIKMMIECGDRVKPPELSLDQKQIQTKLVELVQKRKDVDAAICDLENAVGQRLRA